ncbi:hypothetical protein CEXT_806101 [Caerostris extrusa]|uniref:Uncharacterized protein n=1 Tax=Caerostris extrusa TaxID=172846 RepID=A0AAV4TQ79_CAEEX|nr:hypothetical protein CEXT_806101 [Caerostris extrusa]
MLNLPESQAAIDAAVLREFYKRKEKTLPNYPQKEKASHPRNTWSQRKILQLSLPHRLTVDPVDDAFIFDNAVALKECIHLRQAVA